MTSSQTVNYTVDATPPTVTGITSVAGDSSAPYYDITNDSSTVVSYSSSADAVSCKWNTTDVAYASMSNTCASTSSCTLNLAGDGAKTVYMRCLDAAGLTSTSSYTLNYTVDSTGPTGSIANGSGNPTNDDTPTLDLTIADAGIGITGAQMQFSCDNSTWSALEAYATPKTDLDIKPAVATYGCGTADGSRTVYVRFQDSLGNTGSSYNTGAFTLDTAAPTISSITSVAGDTSAPYYDITDDSSTSIIFVSADTTTSVSACKWNTTDVAYASMTNTCASATNCVTNLSGDGAKTVYLRCIDAAGNVMASSQTVSYTVYSTLPTVTDAKISIAGASGTGGAYKVGDIITVTWNNSASGDNNTDLTVAPTANLSGWGGSTTATMTDTTACGGTASDDIYEACYTLVSGAIDTTNVNASVTATNIAGPRTTADTTNATVDNQAPNITSNGTLTITTDNGVTSVAALNNGTSNQDKVTQSVVTLSVADSDTTTINLVALTGQSALAAATESTVVTPGALDSATQTFTITVTDNAGNVTTDTSDAISVDNIAPNITANGTLTITVDNGVSDVAAVNNGFDNQDKVTQSAVTLSAADSDTTTIDLTALTGEATLSAATQSSVITPGALDSATQAFTITVTDNAGNTATTASDAISVDNILPTVSASAISVTGATGGSGEFIEGDTATGRWDDSATGDNNTDTISSVSFDLSDFLSTDTAVSGSNTTDIWTASITDVLDIQRDTNNNTIVTATDNAGNIQATSGTNNYNVENAPVAPGGVFSNINLWLRADSSSVAQSGNGTAATSWTDLSTNAHLFDRTTSGIGGTDPIWYASRMSGEPAVAFPATTDRLGKSNFTGMPTGDFWVTTVYQELNTASTYESLWTYGANNANTIMYSTASFHSVYGEQS